MLGWGASVSIDSLDETCSVRPLQRSSNGVPTHYGGGVSVSNTLNRRAKTKLQAGFDPLVFIDKILLRKKIGKRPPGEGD